MDPGPSGLAGLAQTSISSGYLVVDTSTSGGEVLDTPPAAAQGSVAKRPADRLPDAPRQAQVRGGESRIEGFYDDDYMIEASIGTASTQYFWVRYRES